MNRLRTILLLVCSLLVLAAGIPARGVVWCLRNDGSLRIEATGPDGRCADLSENTSAEAYEASAVPRFVFHSAPCVDFAAVFGPLVTRSESEAERIKVPAPVAFRLVLQFAFSEPIDSGSYRRNVPLDPGQTATSDIACIRDTVALVI